MKINLNMRNIFGVCNLHAHHVHIAPLQVLNVLMMSPYCYFAKASKQSHLPDPSGPLSASVSPAAIKEGNDAFQKCDE